MPEQGCVARASFGVLEYVCLCQRQDVKEILEIKRKQLMEDVCMDTAAAEIHHGHKRDI